jgi:hypothetical protein
MLFVVNAFRHVPRGFVCVGRWVRLNIRALPSLRLRPSQRVMIGGMELK